MKNQQAALLQFRSRASGERVQRGRLSPPTRSAHRRSGGLLLLVAALCVLSGLLACQSEGDDLKHFATAPINGIVYDFENRPCPNVTVKLNDKFVIRTDINGRFTFLRMPPGAYSLTFEKQGYESLAIEFDFRSRAQVLYAKIISLKALVLRAEEALAEKKWSETESLLVRAKAIDSENPTVQYLEATLALFQGRVEEATQLLKTMLEQGHSNTTILLSLADIYQYRLDDPNQARQYLAAYLSIEENPEIRKRYEKLSP